MTDETLPYPESHHDLHVAAGAVVVDCSLCVVAALERADAERIDKAAEYADSLQVLKLRASMTERGFVWVPGHLEPNVPWTTTHPHHRANLWLLVGVMMAAFCLGQLVWMYTGA